MGAPDWQRQSFAKNPTTPNKGNAVTKTPNSSIREVQLFQHAGVVEVDDCGMQGPLKLADGGDVNVKGDTIGDYSGADPIVQYRMNQIDAKGEDLRIPESAKTTQSQADAKDMENGSSQSTPEPKRFADDMGASAHAKASTPSTSSTPVKASTAPAPKVKDTSMSPAASDARLKAKAPKAPSYGDEFVDDVQSSPTKSSAPKSGGFQSFDSATKDSATKSAPSKSSTQSHDDLIKSNFHSEMESRVASQTAKGSAPASTPTKSVTTNSNQKIGDVLKLPSLSDPLAKYKNKG